MAHNGQRFDFQLLSYEFLRHGLCSKEDYLTFGRKMKIDGFVDSVKMFQHPYFWKECSAIKFPPVNNKLGTIYEHLFMKKLDGAHDALKDVLAMEEILSSPACRDIWLKFAFRCMYIH